MNNKTIITIFGATGDLSYRKLMPALYNLFCLDKLGDDFEVIAIGRREYTHDEYSLIIKPWTEKFSRIKYDEEKFATFTEHLKYVRLDFTDLSRYADLKSKYTNCENAQNLFYLAVAPQFFDVISEGICSLGINKNIGVVVEKPFGETLEHAHRLGLSLDDMFGAENVYRIDHYLGKEMIRSIETIRFTNTIFSSCWNNEFIENVQIVASEEVGVESRAGYYDTSGALKDMVQNHLMQILTIVAMEKPDGKKSLKECQLDVLRNLRPIKDVNVSQSLLLAQYDGYLEEKNVAQNSKTETFAFCKLYVDSERFKDVPFYIITGKKLATREMNVIITFKKTSEEYEPNILVFKIQPDVGVSLRFNSRTSGESEKVAMMEMDFCRSSMADYRINSPEAYERLLFSALCSDRSSFTEWEQIYLSWKYIDELKTAYNNSDEKIHRYEKGSTAPSALYELMAKLGHKIDYTQFYCIVT